MAAKQVILFLGIPGVGKTTVTNELLQQAKARRVAISVITYSDVMLECARSRGLVRQRDEMRRLPIESQLNLQRETAEKISRMGNEDETVIVDTHSLVKVGKNAYWPGVPEWVAKALKPRGIVLLEAPIESILERRRKDADIRKRDVDDRRIMEDHLAFSRIAAFSVATLTGAYVKILENEDGEQARVAEEMLKTLLGE